MKQRPIKISQIQQSLKNAYNKTEASLVTLTDKQIAYNEQLKAEKIENLNNKIKDINVFLEEQTKKYGKNADTVKNLKEEIIKYQSQLDALQGTKQTEINSNDNLNNSTDKVKTKYDLLNEQLKDTEEKYKNVVFCKVDVEWCTALYSCAKL